MGAGTETEHYIQDAGEIYFVWKCMEYLQVLETVSSDINVENPIAEISMFDIHTKELKPIVEVQLLEVHNEYTNKVEVKFI